MATHDLSRIVAENGDIYLIKAKGLEDQIQLSLTGDVSGQVTTDLSGNASISTTIANGAVGTAKLADSAVTTGKIADKAVTLDKIADSAKGGAVQDNDGVLATHSQVKNYVDSVVAGEGKYRGIQTVATINTWTAANLNNGDRVITQDAGTITLGNFSVEADQELIFWKDAESQVWQTSEGNYKLKQTAVTFTGSTLKTPTSIAQDANGDITTTFSDIQSASTSQKGVVQLSDATDSTSTALAATANAVKKAYDLASNAKPKQTAKTSPTASGSDIAFIDTITQDANGVTTATKKTVRSASASQSGVMSAEHFSKLEALDPTTDAEKEVLSATKLKNARTIDGVEFDGSGNIVHYGTCSTAYNVQAKVISCPGFVLTEGARIIIKFTQNNNYTDPTFNVNNTGAIGVKYFGGNLPSGNFLRTGAVYEFMYDGTNYCFVGNFDNNNYVYQSALSTDAEYPLICKNNANQTAENNAVHYASGITMNPSTNKITASGGFVGSLEGNAATASEAASGSALESEIASKQDALVFDGTYNASTNKAATVSSITSRIAALDATATSADGTNVQVKVTEADGKVTTVNITKDDTEKAFSINYRASDHALVFSKAFGTVS